MIKEPHIEIGFWPSGDEGKAAVASHVDHSFKDDLTYQPTLWFLQHPTRRVRFMDVSNCRLCGNPNGNQGFYRDGFVWPSGYSHYVMAHGLRPPNALIAAAVKAYRREVK